MPAASSLADLRSQIESDLRGRVLSPADLASQLSRDGQATAISRDAVRFVLLRHVTFGRDGDLSHEAMVDCYNADLANDFGNLLNRTLNMVTRYVDGERVPPARVDIRLCSGY